MGRIYKACLLHTKAQWESQRKALCDCLSCELNFSVENHFCSKECLANCGLFSDGFLSVNFMEM